MIDAQIFLLETDSNTHNAKYRTLPTRLFNCSMASAVTSSRPWTEKYRPKSLRGVAFQSNVVRVLNATLFAADASKEQIADEKRMTINHLLFHGPPGTGKTTTIHAVARQWFPTDALFRQRVLELNASDERGVNVVRNEIIKFAQQPVMPDPTGRIPPFRLLILDEADSMTDAAQAALRRTMERFAIYTRFCLLCNYTSGLISPLVSRCSPFHFRSPTPKQMSRRLLSVLQREKLLLGADDEEHARIVHRYAEYSEGDMRRALHWFQCLQAVWLAKKMKTREEDKERDDTTNEPEKKSDESESRCSAQLAQTILQHMSGRPSDELIEDLVQLLLNEDGDTEFTDWDIMLRVKVFHQGFSVVACVQQIATALLQRLEKNAHLATIVCGYLEKLAEIDAAMHQGANGQLQLITLLTPTLFDSIVTNK